VTRQTLGLSSNGCSRTKIKDGSRRNGDALASWAAYLSGVVREPSRSSFWRGADVLKIDLTGGDMACRTYSSMRR
jgi:hypothetical protein